MVNDCQFIGRLGKDPELKSSQGGKSYATFSIALDKGKGEKKETLWLNVTTFDKQAEFAGTYLKKGGLVYIKGELAIDSFTDKEGAQRTAPKILANRVVSLEKRAATGETAGTSQAVAPAATQIAAEDIPF